MQIYFFFMGTAAPVIPFEEFAQRHSFAATSAPADPPRPVADSCKYEGSEKEKIVG